MNFSIWGKILTELTLDLTIIFFLYISAKLIWSLQLFITVTSGEIRSIFNKSLIK